MTPELEAKGLRAAADAARKWPSGWDCECNYFPNQSEPEGFSDAKPLIGDEPFG
jgi:hypothetical protein